MTSGGLIEKLNSLGARVGVVGLGYVGLPFCIAAAAKGLSTTGFDIDPEKCAALAAGRSYFEHIDDALVAEMVATGRFEATADFSHMSEMDIIVICVPTPLTRHREPDLSYLVRTGEDIVRSLRAGQMVILESTTYPGTTEEVLRPILERSGLVAHEDFFLAFSPEREDPGNGVFTTSTIPKVVGADTDAERKIAETFYSIFIDKVVVVSSTRTAEMVKLKENIFRSVNIALVNEMKIVCEAMDIDIWEVIAAASTKPFGYMPFYPGPGLGGHCIPIDPFYLTWKAREYDIATRFIELAGEINSSMPKRVVERLAHATDVRLGKGLNGTKVLVVGVAYKKNIDDMRESPALEIIELLERRGSCVAYFDPLVPAIPRTREHPQLEGRKSLAWADDIATDFDAVLIVTDHDGIDYASLVRSAPLVVDSRNACRAAKVWSHNIVLV